MIVQGGSDGEASAYMQETQFQSLGREDPLEKEMATHSSVLAWKIHGRRSLVGYSPWGRKESDTTERLHFLFFLHVVHVYHLHNPLIKLYLMSLRSFPDGTGVKELPANAEDARDVGLIPRPGRSPGEGNGNPRQYFS